MEKIFLLLNLTSGKFGSITKIVPYLISQTVTFINDGKVLLLLSISKIPGVTQFLSVSVAKLYA